MALCVCVYVCVRCTVSCGVRKMMKVSDVDDLKVCVAHVSRAMMFWCVMILGGGFSC